MNKEKGFAENLLAEIDTMSTERVVARGELIIREGEVERNIYFIESGAVRVFLLTEFEELTIRFGYKGSFINSLSSFITGGPSEFYMDAIRKTTIKVVAREDLMRFVNRSEECLRQYSQLLEVLIQRLAVQLRLHLVLLRMRLVTHLLWPEHILVLMDCILAYLDYG